jgi:hypothetical protein
VFCRRQLGFEPSEQHGHFLEKPGVVGLGSIAEVAVRQNPFARGGNLLEPLAAVRVLDEMPDLR